MSYDELKCMHDCKNYFDCWEHNYRCIFKKWTMKELCGIDPKPINLKEARTK